MHVFSVRHMKTVLGFDYTNNPYPISWYEHLRYYDIKTDKKFKYWHNALLNDKYQEPNVKQGQCFRFWRQN